MFDRLEEVAGLRFFPWAPCPGTEHLDPPEYYRRCIDDHNLFISGMVWQDDVSVTYPHAPRRWNIIFSFDESFATKEEAMDESFATKEEAMEYLDSLLVSHGAILLKEKLMVML